MKTPIRTLLLVLLMGAAGGGAWYAWRQRAGGGEAAASYRTELASRGDVAATVTATGSISAVTTVQVGSQVSGIIARLLVDFNSRVARGDLLAELDPTTYQAQVEQRRADLLRAEVDRNNAKLGYERQRRLRDEGLAAEAEYDAASAQHETSKAVVDQAAAALRQAETNLRNTRILSPIDGVVVDRQYDVGQTVAASFQAPTLFTIAQDLTRMQVQADVDQSDIGRVQIGQPARFFVDAYPDQEFRGQISQIRLNATVNQNVITYPVIIEIPNPEERLRPKMTATVTIEVARVSNVLRIPNGALRFRPPAPAGDGKGPDEARRAGSGGAGGVGRARPGPPPAGASGSGPAPEVAAARLAEAPVREGAVAAAGALLAAGAAGGARGMQTIQVLDDRGGLRPVRIRPGITDGRFTEVVDGEVKEGDKVVVGLATVKGDESGGTLPGGGRGPRMGRF